VQYAYPRFAVSASETAASRVPLRWVFWALVLVVGIGAVAGLLLLRTSGGTTASSGTLETMQAGPSAVWAAGAVRAPTFRLRDAEGKPVSPAQFRGRLLVVTFVDPLCKTFCPRESRVLADAVARLPALQRPAFVAVSVNPPVQEPRTLRREARRFGWLPGWRWAVGTQGQLAAVWHSYHIAVLPTKGDVAHTEAAYVVDANGYERALFLWPFRAREVEQTLRRFAG